MNLYFLPEPAYDGRILKVLWDKDIFSTDLSNLNPDYEIFHIDEVEPDNKNICLDLKKKQNLVDDINEPKYSIVDNAGIPELQEKIDWVEKGEDIY